MAPRVLVVEDDPEQRLLLQLTLEPHFSLAIAQDGQEAMDELDAHGDEYDVLVTDLAMPGRNGHDVVAHARSLAATRDLPIVVLAARDDRNVAVPTGSFRFMAKPFDPDDLVTTLRALAGVSGAAPDAGTGSDRRLEVAGG